jgi:hypothetical protein
LNAFSRETLSYAADFLDRPRDEIGCLGVALDLVFLRPGALCWRSLHSAALDVLACAHPRRGDCRPDQPLAA